MTGVERIHKANGETLKSKERDKYSRNKKEIMIGIENKKIGKTKDRNQDNSKDKKKEKGKNKDKDNDIEKRKDKKIP